MASPQKPTESETHMAELLKFSLTPQGDVGRTPVFWQTLEGELLEFCLTSLSNVSRTPWFWQEGRGELLEFSLVLPLLSDVFAQKPTDLQRGVGRTPRVLPHSNFAPSSKSNVFHGIKKRMRENSWSSPSYVLYICGKRWILRGARKRNEAEL